MERCIISKTGAPDRVNIPFLITTGYDEMVTQMHSQARWPSTASDLISVIFLHIPACLN